MNKHTDHIGSLAKGLRVLECFDADHPRMSISEVSVRTGLDRATARRCLLTLSHEGYAEYDGKYFSLTPRTLRLGIGVLSSLPLPQIVQPWLDQLTEQIGQSCSVAILEGSEIVYLARAAQKKVMSIGLMPGSRLPAHCTSLGRVLLAALPEDKALTILDRTDLSPRTPRSLSNKEEILARLKLVAAQGYATIDEEVEIGLRSIAVPLIDRKGTTVAALNTGMAATHHSMEDLVSEFLPPLKRVQESLRDLL